MFKGKEMKYTLEEVCKILENIIYDKTSRVNEIKIFQNIVWNEDESFTSEIDDCLSDLAQDLDYYEDNEKIRKEDSSYYGEERLIKELNDTLSKLRKYL